VDGVPLAGDERELLEVAASVEAQSDHPLAKAIVAAARARGIEPLPVRDIEQRKGSGIAATLDGRAVLVVSPKACDGHRAPRADAALTEAVNRLEGAARTVAVVIADGRFLGVLGLLDRPREEAREAFALLRQRGVRTVAMLTGDNAKVAAAIGREVGVDRIEAGLLPEEKIEAVRRLERELGPVDVALMRDDLRSLSFAIGLSRATRTIIRVNIAIAMGVVVLLIVLAAFGLVPMPIAVVIHEGSTVVVVLIALTLLRYRE
jgi:Cd2+/Zn2+-exporting ATPase